MLKTLKLFLIFFFCLPSVSLAWNSSCYSPVQLAAFMSQPKKSSRGISQSSVSGIRAKIRGLERALDKVEGDLQDSLDRNKLKAKPSTVAGDIRDYIEDGQDGWDCSKGGQSSLFFFPSLIPKAYAQEDPRSGVLNTLLGQDKDSVNKAPKQSDKALGTVVEAKENSPSKILNKELGSDRAGKRKTASPVRSQSIGERESRNTGLGSKSKSSVRNCSALHPAMELKGNRCVCKAGYKRTAANQCIKKTESGKTGSGAESQPAVQRQKAGKASSGAESQPAVQRQKAGKAGSGAESQSAVQRQKAGKAGSGAESQPAVQRQKAGKAGSEAESQSAVQRQKAGKAGSGAESQPAVQRKKSKKELCAEQGSAWQWTGKSCIRNCSALHPAMELKGNRCICKAGYKRTAANQCARKTKRDICKEKSFIWKGGKCFSPDQLNRADCEKQPGLEWIGGECKITPKTKCESRPGSWKWSDRQCICPSPYKKDGNNCRAKTKEEKCKDKSFIWKDGKCFSPERLERARCEKQPGMEWIGGECKKTAQNKCESRPGPWKWSDGRCNCPSPYKKDGNNCRAKTKEEKCKDKSFIWKDGKCLSSDQLEQVRCEKQPGMEWIGGECKKTTQNKCESRPGPWKWSDGRCNCPLPYKTDGDNCRAKTEEEKCAERPGHWLWNRTACICPRGSKKSGKSCLSKTEEDRCKHKGEGWTWQNGKCVKCPDWKKHSGFKSNGKVSSSFCDEYAQDKGDCKRALSHLHRRAKQLKRLEEQLDSLESRLLEASLNPDEESATEAGGVCFDCLKRIIKSSQPSSGQVAGQSLSLLLGAGLSIAGYQIGKNAQTHANMMRIKEGYPSLYNGFSLTGMGAGYPYMANSLYGMTRAATPVGGWACSPTVSPYGHSHNHGYGYGYNMGYY